MLYSFVILLIVKPSVAQEWSTIKAGLEQTRGLLSDGSRRAKFELFRCDPRKRSIRVVDVANQLGQKSSLSAFSLRAVSEKTHPIVIFNAGSTASFNFPSPVGWLKIDGKEISRAAFKVSQAAALCLSPGHVSIDPLLPNKLPSCKDEVQRGPFLPRDFQPVQGISNGTYRRTVVAVDKQGRLLILVTVDPISFRSVVSYLYSSTSGLDITAAFALDSAASSGLLLLNDPKSSSGELAVGSVEGLIASAIEIR